MRKNRDCRGASWQDQAGEEVEAGVTEEGGPGDTGGVRSCGSQQQWGAGEGRAGNGISAFRERLCGCPYCIKAHCKSSRNTI